MTAAEVWAREPKPPMDPNGPFLRPEPPACAGCLTTCPIALYDAAILCGELWDCGIVPYVEGGKGFLAGDQPTPEQTKRLKALRSQVVKFVLWYTADTEKQRGMTDEQIAYERRWAR